ncbi:MAG: ribbon-helix-helix protein, CopG family [Acidobacteriota bacterium]
MQRINAALDLLQKDYSASEAARELADRCGISQRQAYRYVQQAQEVGKPVPVPERKIAFTVKLSEKLVHGLRQYARSTGKSLSEIVTQALQAFLRNR